MIIFPYEREAEVQAILGQQMDVEYNKQYGLTRLPTGFTPPKTASFSSPGTVVVPS